ncbi:MarR family winged helix-turn-helix transcriptional regulator [Paenibacillus sp. URB8-2]|uniref:MarR family winged helix-turn-helix transcriptional regulator n=1 Tax=Paenibacillus sp. URB8-2 TaxID=2741301 RepID=UPI0015BD29C6|nr:MarR family transcriptional regulator [Paenibacillus sp. URB8-2]BCG59015.1 transcriptional regulator [Paenibacillus sp. URB8-2]
MTLPNLQHSPGFLLGSAYRRISILFSRALKPFDITPEQWTVLYTIASHDNVNQKAVAASVDKDQPTTARILELLGKKGLITKTVSDNDRRAYLLNATAEGKALIDSTLALEQQNLDSAFAGLSPSQIEELRLILKTICRNTGNIYED